MRDIDIYEHDYHRLSLMLTQIEAIEATVTIGEKKPPKPARPTRSDIPPGTMTRQQRRFAERRGEFLPQDEKGEGL